MFSLILVGLDSQMRENMLRNTSLIGPEVSRGEAAIPGYARVNINA
jgi:hypothetical protein